MRFKLFSLVSLSLLLGACALSPQQVTINPTLEPSKSNIGEGRTLYLEVVDNRGKEAIGSRGGLYKDTSLITPANDLADAILAASTRKFREMGFVVQTMPLASADIRIVVDTLSYRDPEKSSVGFEVELESLLRVEATQNGDSYTGRYQVKNTKTYATVPGRDRNEEMINETLSAALQRLFSDPKLLAFTLR
ncbi:YajG family lipoprotein [Litorivivens sp.]|uniref:YajG family lipoprotein n=2 Tax=Litorivivens sp. TaxID=2020868 RepID=UPI0035654F24